MWVEVHLGRLIIDQAREHYEVELLARSESGRCLALPIGVVDTALCERATRREEDALDPHQLTIDLVHALGARLEEVRLEARSVDSGTELRARLRIRDAVGKRSVVTARAIDACLIAARLGVPIRVERTAWTRWSTARGVDRGEDSAASQERH